MIGWIILKPCVPYWELRITLFLGLGSLGHMQSYPKLFRSKQSMNMVFKNKNNTTDLENNSIPKI